MKALALCLLGLALVAAQAQAPTKPEQPAAPAKPAQATQPAAPTQQPAEQQQLRGEGTAGGKGVPLWKLSEEQLKFRPSEPIRGSVLTATKLVMDAALAREPGTAGVHFAPFTTIIYKSILPNGGIYKGWLGLMDYISRAKLTFQLNNLSYSIPFVDEARGFSAVKLKYSGKFIRSGKALEGSSTMYMKWRFGKIRKVYLVDDDAEAVMNAFFTPAEKVAYEFYNSLFECGDCASKFLADNFKTTVRLSPKSASQKLSYEGIDAFKKHVNSPAGNLMLNQVQGIKFLYGSDDTAVVLTKLAAGSPAMRIAGGLGRRSHGVDTNAISGASVSDVGSLSDLASVSIVKVKDGKIVSCNAQLNQPILPWHMRQLGLYAEKKIEETGATKGAVTGTAGQQKGEQKTAATGEKAGEQKGKIVA